MARGRGWGTISTCYKQIRGNHDLLKFEMCAETATQTHQAGIWVCASGTQERSPGQEMSWGAVGLGKVFKAMGQDGIAQGECGLKTEPREEPQGAPT